ncbi:MAG: cytochrome c biogenesis protein CcsA [Pirellulales bacterium]
MTKASSRDTTPALSRDGSSENRLRAWTLGKFAVDVVGSPRLTAALFLAAVGLILLGTLAQVYQDMWEVIDDYFRAWVSWVDLKILFPPSFFPWAVHTDWDSFRIRSFPFPGGALIGLALVVNLTAAHATRFKMQARGARLAAGLVVLAVGVATTWLVITAGHNRQGLQGEPILPWSTLWVIIQVGLVALGLGCGVAFAYVWRSSRRGKSIELGLLASSALGLALLLAWIFVKGEAAVLTDSSLRILYQLIQGQIAAAVLLLACVLLFHKRAGIALLHGGVGLLMFGEFFVSHFAVEQQMTLREGETVSHTRDIRSVELAIRAMNEGERRNVVAVAMAANGTATRFARGDLIQLDDLPFDIQVVRYFKNSTVRSAGPDDSNMANRGFGKRFVAEDASQRRGVQGGQIDLASAYVKFLGKQDGESLGTYLLSQHFSSQTLPESLTVGGKGYNLGLRFKRSNKPYQITLLDVRKDDYLGTSMPRNYSSQVRLTDPSRDVNLEAKIWMNNPLRYAGETFYQSGYNVDPRGNETSTLQVVRNTGWMIPYVSCMIAATGMLAHFLLVLLRFLRRIQGGTDHGAENGSPVPPDRTITGGQAKAIPSVTRCLVPLTVVLFGMCWVAGKAMPPNKGLSSQMRLEEFGKLPVMYEGRVKPLDTLARNSLRVLSNRQTFVDASGKKQPAIRWLLDVIARPEVAEKHRVFRIDSLEVLETFGLDRRKGFRYSREELRAGMMEYQKQVAGAQQQSPEKRTFYQRKVLDLAQRMHRYRVLMDAFRPLPFPASPTPEAISSDLKKAANNVTAIERLVNEVPRTNRVLLAMQPPLAVPIGPPEQPWLAYAAARNTAYVDQHRRQKEPAPLLTTLTEIFDAYEQNSPVAFNRAVSDYQRKLAVDAPAGFEPRITDFEAYFNHFAPFYHLIPLYLAGLLLTAFGWLTAAAFPRLSTLMRSSTFWLIVFAFAMHTFALGARVAISGRPPVTNLYSSAVFVGWGCVLIGMFLEAVYRLGIGNLVSSAAGIGALIIAHSLAGSGDTIRVLQAVLDTQFWLTTHVLTVTLGYSATFFAGLLGVVLIAWCVLGKPLLLAADRLRRPAGERQLPHDWLSSSHRSEVEKTLEDMIFGTVCFATLFSFVGTVLGGLWADDSWGRFWGWDPKENGALIVVLWNALVLHAHWSRMVKARGLAMLVIGGNVVTAWSWFGVNELGVGLHSYGFTEGAARALLLFWTSQFVIIVLGLLPVFVEWMVHRRSPSSES